MNHNRLYVDLHVLQTVPPSCVNRDDTGSPKSAVYGGAIRARVSSQAWKHAMREAFRTDLLNREKVGMRTKKILEMVEEKIRSLSPEIDAEKAAKKALGSAGFSFSKKAGQEKNLDTLFFISEAQAKAIAELAVSGVEDKKAYQQALQDAPAIDMLLFGRMVAADANLNYDAAAQVAHSISTHRVQTEYDYFTAVDDCASEEDTGAGHLGTVEFNSSTLYRYATLNVQELLQLGKDDTLLALRAFAEAFLCSMPTGKQNTFANRTLPDAVYAVVRTDQPVNLCGAFERPVPASEEGYIEPSKRRLIDYAQQLYSSFADAPVAAFTVGSGLESLAPALPLQTMLDTLMQTVAAYIPENEVE